jgi:hypothetical protein
LLLLQVDCGSSTASRAPPQKVSSSRQSGQPAYLQFFEIPPATNLVLYQDG